MTLEELEELVNKAYSERMCSPCTMSFMYKNGNKTSCCGIGAAYLASGAKDISIVDWAYRILGEDTVNAFSRGFDEYWSDINTFDLDCYTEEFKKAFYLGQKLAKKWIVNRGKDV